MRGIQLHKNMKLLIKSNYMTMIVQVGNTSKESTTTTKAAGTTSDQQGCKIED